MKIRGGFRGRGRGKKAEIRYYKFSEAYFNILNCVVKAFNDFRKKNFFQKLSNKKVFDAELNVGKLQFHKRKRFCSLRDAINF